MNSNERPFSPNFEFLKKHAKKRLKAIKSGNLDELKRLHQFFPTLREHTCKLADVQCLIAREYGLSSWNRLKSHCHLLSFSEAQIQHSSQPHDIDLKTLHIRCGHDIQSTLSNSHFGGDFLALIDPYFLGPLSDFNATEIEPFIKSRAEFAHDAFIEPLFPSHGIDKTLNEQRGIEKQLGESFNQYERIIIWCEHDPYDQGMLIRLLSFYAPYLDKVLIELINIDFFPGNKKFIGLGQLPPEALLLLWNSRQPITQAQCDYATDCWQALVSGELKVLTKHIEDGRHALPFLEKAVFRALQELPHAEHGLGMTQYYALTILKEHHSLTVFELFERFSSGYDPLPWLGDIMFWSLIKPLTESTHALLKQSQIASDSFLGSIQLTLSPLGWDVLNKSIRASWLEHHVVGRRHNEEHGWQWDHKKLSSLTKY